MQDELTKRRANRLIHEKSPYLLQHAYNPVDWFPWSDEAFEKAKVEDKPIFLSIGYSTCHWCHVMEKECFEDQEVAELMNETFVSIKVDREERPDLDNLYMTVCQMMGGSCGWPLNVIMTHNGNPFFATSYIPKISKFGLVGMVDLVPQMKEIWKTRRNELENVGKQIKSKLEILEKTTPEGEPAKDVLDEAYDRLVLNFDEHNGGFGGAPKFPTPQNLLFLLRYWQRSKEKTAIMIVNKTLRAIRAGGIFDQVGFGFHRYSTDARWLVPHFEKMLYDQALLALVYTEAFQATGSAEFKQTAKEVLDYVLRDLAVADGGFYSAEDADSEGVEGKFYQWTEEEIKEALLTEDTDLAIRIFGVEKRGNFIEATTGSRNSKNILHLVKPLEQIASEHDLTLDELILGLSRIRKSLFDFREKRVRLGKDDKVLADWNGLMIAALARASQVFGEEKYLHATIRAANFVLEKMRDDGGLLYHRYAKSEKAVAGFLDDYAFLVWGLIEIYEAIFDDRYLQTALELTKVMIEKFWDENDGGFYFTAKDAESVMVRRKEAYDGAIPSGNSVAMLNLLRLARLTGNSAYEEMSAKLARAFSGEIRKRPEAHTFMLLGLDFVVGPTYNVILVGSLQEEDTLNMLAALRGYFFPNVVVSLKRAGEPSTEMFGLGYEKIDGKATAYVCKNQTCLPPTNKIEKMLESLGVSSSAAEPKNAEGK